MDLEYLRQTYSQLETQELIRLLSLREGLESDALLVLQEELARRGETQVANVPELEERYELSAHERRTGVGRRILIVIGALLAVLATALIAQVLKDQLKSGRYLVWIAGSVVSIAIPLWWLRKSSRGEAKAPAEEGSKNEH